MDRRGNEDRSTLVVALNGKVAGLAHDSGSVLWTNTLDGGGFGEVFLAIGFGCVFASATGSAVFCLDLRTGSTIWKAKTQSSGRAAIVVEPSAVYVAKGGFLDCFAHDGSPLWSSTLKGLGLGRIALGFPGNVAQADDPGKE